MNNNNEFVAEELERMLFDVKQKISINCINRSEISNLNEELCEAVETGLNELLIEEFRLESALKVVHEGKESYHLLPQENINTIH